MDNVELRIFRKRQYLRDLLNTSLTQEPTFLPLIKILKSQIHECNYLLEEFYKKKSKVEAI